MLLTDIMVSVDIDEKEEKIVFAEKKKNNFVSHDEKIWIEVEQDCDSDGKRMLVKRCSAMYEKYKESIVGLFDGTGGRLVDYRKS